MEEKIILWPGELFCEEAKKQKKRINVISKATKDKIEKY